MRHSPYYPSVPVYRVRWAPGIFEGHNFGNALRHNRSQPTDRTFDLILTDDKYLASTDIDEAVPTVTVPCYMLGYGPEISATNGEGLHVWMKFSAVPDVNHGLDLPDPFWLMGEDYEDSEPTDGFVNPSVPDFGL